MGGFIKVTHDADATGGFFIFTSQVQSMHAGYDNWVPDEAALARYFAESNWVIEWLED